MHSKISKWSSQSKISSSHRLQICKRCITKRCPKYSIKANFCQMASFTVYIWLWHRIYQRWIKLNSWFSNSWISPKQVYWRTICHPKRRIRKFLISNLSPSFQNHYKHGMMLWYKKSHPTAGLKPVPGNWSLLVRFHIPFQKNEKGSSSLAKPLSPKEISNTSSSFSNT